jgi:hypothetical protein
VKAKDPAAEKTALKEKQRYVKGYLQVVQRLYKRNSFTKEQARLAEIAYQRRLVPSEFVVEIRKNDPAYVRTEDYKLRQTEASEVWNRLRPGRPMPHDYSSRYVASNLNKVQLIEKSERAAAARAGGPVRPVPNPAAYRKLRSMLNTAHEKQNGSAPNPLLHRMIFSAKMQDRDINERFADLFGGKNSFQWMQGVSPGNDQIIRDSVLKAAQPPQMKLSSAKPVFLGAGQNQFQIGVDDLSASLISSEME